MIRITPSVLRMMVTVWFVAVTVAQIGLVGCATGPATTEPVKGSGTEARVAGIGEFVGVDGEVLQTLLVLHVGLPSVFKSPNANPRLTPLLTQMSNATPPPWPEYPVLVDIGGKSRLSSAKVRLYGNDGQLAGYSFSVLFPEKLPNEAFVLRISMPEATNKSFPIDYFKNELVLPPRKERQILPPLSATIRRQATIAGGKVEVLIETNWGLEKSKIPYPPFPELVRLGDEDSVGTPQARSVDGEMGPNVAISCLFSRTPKDGAPISMKFPGTNAWVSVKRSMPD